MTTQEQLIAIEAATNEWVDALITAAATGAAEAYAAGSMYALGKMQQGINLDKTKKASLQYAVEYKRRLVETGEIDITVPVRSTTGVVTGHQTAVYPWLKDKPAVVRNEIADIITRGIAEGRATGVRQSKNGMYASGSIASELQAYFDAQRSHASTVARTETGRCYCQGELEMYRAAGVEFLIFLGAPDACEECQPYIGKIFRIGSEPVLPLHPNCRCNYAPFYPEVGEIVNCGDGV